MSKIAVVTDSNSGIKQSQAKELGVYVVPMPFYINEELYYEDITLTREQFYEKLAEDAEISTSQPSPGDVMDMWNNVLKDYDEIIHIPMSSGLSSACENAMFLSREYKGRVHVIDNQRVSVTQRQSVMDALEMTKKGMSAQEIADVLMREKLDASIYIMVDTLKYLKKGGRVTAAGAALGAVLNLKPVLQIQGEKLDAFAKTRGIKAAKKKMIAAMKNDLATRFADKKIHLQAAYTCSEQEAQEWKAEIEDHFPEFEVHMDPLSLSVSCHIGPGAIAIACCKQCEEL